MSSPIDALASPRRREILRLVWGEERAAGEIHAALADVTFGAVSQHLRILAGTGLVTVRRDGRRRLYRADPRALGPVAGALEAMWNDALYRLKLSAELEEARRGPRPAGRFRSQVRSQSRRHRHRPGGRS
jgi:DNA-binding transcriptional ArsR family regulator